VKIEEDILNMAHVNLQSLVSWWCTYGFDENSNRFYAEVQNDNTPCSRSSFVIIQRARLLWFFSSLSQNKKYGDYRKYADLQYEELIQSFYDEDHGGFIWELSVDGEAINKRKQTYAQAFVIYALSEYYILGNNEHAKSLAIETFHLLESNAFDNIKLGYIEAVNQKWEHIDDVRLSPKDMNEPKTMNTHLHILEAYTGLSKITTDQEISEALKRVLNLYNDKFYNLETGHFQLFFDNDWNIKSNIVSFGHDIESAWLMQKAAYAVGDNDLIKKVAELSLRITDVTIREGRTAMGGIKNEVKNGKQDLTFDWWPQAEAVVGFLDAYQTSGQEEYLEAANQTLLFIDGNILNKENGEWHWRINENLKPDSTISKSNAWKAPYHNGRMYLEILKRINTDDQL